MPYDPTGYVSHEDELHRSQTWKRWCRAATIANITIATALNNGDTLDGVTLATGDRVLVKDQSTGSQNGIYVVGVTPVRAFDMDQDATTAVPASEVLGAIVYVVAGTVNGGTTWRNTNTTAPTLGSTALTFAQLYTTFTDPMTTRGDIIVRNASNATARLGIGAAGKILSSDGTDVSWGNGPMTTQDDIIVGGASGIPTRLGKGSDGQVLTVDPTTHHLVWATSSSGFSNPMTTKGDLIVGDTGGSPIRLAVGTDAYVLTADAASTGGIKWAVGGSSGVDNWLIEIDCFAGSHGNTNWSTINIDNTEFYAGDIESSGAQNDEIYWDLGISGGTWDFDLLHFKGPNRGIYTVSIDGTSAGTIDGYVAIATRNNHGIITGISITAGKRRLKLKMATKNGSSSSYFGTVQHIQLRRTA